MSPFIVAEMSANHLGSLERALAIVDAAAAAGADAIKLQTWVSGTMCVDAGYTLEHGPWAGRTLADLYAEAHTPWDWHPAIMRRAAERGIECFSAAFDRESVEFLESLGVKRHKVASFEITDTPLIRRMAATGKPLIISTGMASVPEITQAYAAASRCKDLTFLKCTSAYPASIADANLATIPDVAEWLGCKAGLSDHSPGHEVAAAAAALGATYIEKHITLARADGGPDAGFSLEPAEFAAMVRAVRNAATARGRVHYGCTASESTTLRRSLYVVRDVAQGEPLVLGQNVRTARPAHGLSPSTVLDGKVARVPLTAGSPLIAEVIA